MRGSNPAHPMLERYTGAKTTLTAQHSQHTITTTTMCIHKAFHVVKDTVLASFGQKQHARINLWSLGTSKGMYPRKRLRP